MKKIKNKIARIADYPIWFSILLTIFIFELRPWNQKELQSNLKPAPLIFMTLSFTLLFFLGIFIDKERNKIEKKYKVSIRGGKYLKVCRNGKPIKNKKLLRQILFSGDKGIITLLILILLLVYIIVLSRF